MNNENTFWARIYTTKAGIHRLLHDILRFLIFFIEQLFIIFNQMLSVQAFCRCESSLELHSANSKKLCDSYLLEIT